MRALSILLLLNWTQAFAQSPQTSPLTDSEKRTVIIQLLELRSCRESVKAYEQFVARETEQDAREKTNGDRALELERQATGIAQQERDLAREKATLYEQMYRSVTKKPGIGCWLGRIFTLGIHRCQ